MPQINWNEINWLAVAIADLAAFFVGGLWYSGLFGKPWMKAQGWSESKVAELKAAMSPPKFFGGMIVSYFILAMAIAILSRWLNIHSAVHGAWLGGVMAIGVGAILFTNHLPSGKGVVGYIVDASCSFVYLIVMGAIIGAWK